MPQPEDNTDFDVMPQWSAVVVALNPRGHVLALTRRFNQRNLALPGGRSEPHDGTPLQTAMRVLFEETGLHGGAEHTLLGQWEDENKLPVYAFHVYATQGKMRVSGKGKPVWVRPRMLFAQTCVFHAKARELLEPLVSQQEESEAEDEEPET